MRWRWRIAFVLSAMLAAALAWLAAPRRARRERLIEALWAEERASDARPTHAAPPLQGSFGDLLEPHLAGLHESFEAYAQLDAQSREAVAAVVTGREPVGRLPPPLVEDFALHRRAMLGALRATHAETARAPPSLRLCSTVLPGTPVLEAVHAGRLAALDLLLLLEEGRNDEAAEECADALALGRDLSYPSLAGRLHGLSVAALVRPACARALSLASPATLERVRGQLVQIRRATPRFASLLQRELLLVRLSLVDSDPRMPESARRAIAELQAQPRTRVDRVRRLFLREASWAPLESRGASLLAAQAQRWPACIDRTAAASRTEPVAGAGWTSLARWPFLAAFTSLPLGAGDAGSFPIALPDQLRRHRDGLIELDAMICLASASLVRARTGVLPRTAAAVCAPSEPQATCGEESAPLKIALHRREARVVGTLSDGSELSLPFAERPRADVHRKKPAKRRPGKTRSKRAR